ncbi:uncharacterized protein LOC106478196 isoform X2 [Limulus polyphemus]|uniref:Uncharacterized protein LOC106478196 isoform X2 n=1 Tax=Limulus polyphemus TaxID=6850 RepID=A0ABM1S1F6_LIMPO|nr:uncharacterized protein LOC106478196 isoform X2 [Limulus polyphemus]
MSEVKLLQNQPHHCLSEKSTNGYVAGTIQNCSVQEKFLDKIIAPGLSRLSTALSEGCLVTQDSMKKAEHVKTQPQVIDSFSVPSYSQDTKSHRMLSLPTLNCYALSDSLYSGSDKSNKSFVQAKSSCTVFSTTNQSRVSEKSPEICISDGNLLNKNGTFGLFVPIKPKPSLPIISCPTIRKPDKDLLENLTSCHLQNASAIHLPFANVNEVDFKQDETSLGKVHAQDLLQDTYSKKDNSCPALEQKVISKLKSNSSDSIRHEIQENNESIKESKKQNYTFTFSDDLQFLKSEFKDTKNILEVLTESLICDDKELLNESLNKIEMQSDKHQYDNSFRYVVRERALENDEILIVNKEMECNKESSCEMAVSERKKDVLFQDESQKDCLVNNEEGINKVFHLNQNDENENLAVAEKHQNTDDLSPLNVPSENDDYTSIPFSENYNSLPAECHRLNISMEIPQVNEYIPNHKNVDFDSLINYSKVFGDKVFCKISLDEIAEKAIDFWSVKDFNKRCSQQTSKYKLTETCAESENLIDFSSFDMFFSCNLPKTNIESIAENKDKSKQQRENNTLKQQDMKANLNTVEITCENKFPKNLYSLPTSSQDLERKSFIEMKKRSVDETATEHTEMNDASIEKFSLNNNNFETSQVIMTDLTNPGSTRDVLTKTESASQIENMAKKLCSSITDDMFRTSSNQVFTEIMDLSYEPSFVDISEIMQVDFKKGDNTCSDVYSNSDKEKESIDQPSIFCGTNILPLQNFELQPDERGLKSVGLLSDNELYHHVDFLSNNKTQLKCDSICKNKVKNFDMNLVQNQLDEELLESTKISHENQHLNRNLENEMEKMTFLKGLGLKSLSCCDTRVNPYERYASCLDVLKDKVISAYLKNPLIPSDRVTSFYCYLCKTGHLQAGKMTFVSEVYRNLRSTSKQVLPNTISSKKDLLPKEMKAPVPPCSAISTSQLEETSLFSYVPGQNNENQDIVAESLNSNSCNGPLNTNTVTSEFDISVCNTSQSASHSNILLTSNLSTVFHPVYTKSNLCTTVQGTSSTLRQSCCENSKPPQSLLPALKPKTTESSETLPLTSHQVSHKRVSFSPTQSATYTQSVSRPVTLVTSDALPIGMNLSEISPSSAYFSTQHSSVITTVASRSLECVSNLEQRSQENYSVILVPFSKPANLMSGGKIQIAVQSHRSPNTQNKGTLNQENSMNHASPVRKGKLEKREISENVSTSIILPHSSNKTEKELEESNNHISNNRVLPQSAKRRKKALECEECGKLYSETSSYAFQKHVRRHKLGKQSKSSSFSNATRFASYPNKNEERMKLRVRTFKCQTCGKAYTDNNILKWHIQTVHNEVETEEETNRLKLHS